MEEEWVGGKGRSPDLHSWLEDLAVPCEVPHFDSHRVVIDWPSFLCKRNNTFEKRGDWMIANSLSMSLTLH